MTAKERKERKERMVGKVYGKLTILDQHTESYISPQGKRQTRWVAQCECGNKCYPTTNNLNMGKQTSCGCVMRGKHPQWLIDLRSKGQSKETAGLVAVYGDYRRGALTRKYEFSITLDEARELFEGSCYYCGSTNSNEHKKSYIPYKYNGIDRLDNSLGYIKDNCVSCCCTCNRMKMDLTEEEFINQVNKIYERFNSK